MKTKALILLCLGALLAGSCARESIVAEPEGREVRITLAADTRAPFSHIPSDEELTTMRIIGFSTLTGKAEFNRLIDLRNAGNNTKTGETVIKTGTFHIAFVGNEDLDPALDLSEGSPSVVSFTTFRNTAAEIGAFRWDDRIPMLGMYRDVQVLGDNHAEGSTVTMENGVWKVALDRLAVRVELTLTLTAVQYKKWGNAVSSGTTTDIPVTLANIPRRMYLMPGQNNDNEGTPQTRAYSAFTDNAGLTKGPGSISTADGSVYTVSYPRILLPETLFADRTNKDKAVRLEIGLSDVSGKTTYTGNIGSEIAAALAQNRDYTLPRNTYVRVAARVDDDVDLDFTVTVVDWDDVTLPSEGN